MSMAAEEILIKVVAWGLPLMVWLVLIWKSHAC
jgi:hypothetical protein